MSGPRQPSQREFSWVPPIRWYGSPQPSVHEFGTGDHVGFRVHRRHRESSKMSDKRLAAEDFVDENHTRPSLRRNEVVGVAVVRQFYERGSQLIGLSVITLSRRQKCLTSGNSSHRN